VIEAANEIFKLTPTRRYHRRLYEHPPRFHENEFTPEYTVPGRVGRLV